jgi:hypothetical protein
LEGRNLVEDNRLERGCEVLGSLKLCRAYVTKEDLRVRERHIKPMRGDLCNKGWRISSAREKHGSRPRETFLGEVNAMGGTGRGFQVTLAAATDSQDARIPEPELTRQTFRMKSRGSQRRKPMQVFKKVDEPAEGQAAG